MKVIKKFTDEAIESGRFKEIDRRYLINKIYALIGKSDVDWDEEKQPVKQLVEIAIKNEKIPNDLTSKEVLNDQLYDLITPLPSAVNEMFWEKMQVNSQVATNWFYNLCIRNNYVKKEAIAKNIIFNGTGKKGHELEITINLSKPEKDPKAIAAAAKTVSKKYPQCALCAENEGYVGGYGENARSNLRIIRLVLGGRKWGFQYSPYAYFNEHCIFLDFDHIPMVINQQTLTNLVEIEKIFPEYFVGSNADLPIVGGSLLSHEHYQGGRHVFPMMKASLKEKVIFTSYPTIKAGIVDWPMSDLRLVSEDTLSLIDLGSKIIRFWKTYSDPMLQINAQDRQGLHHTVTPIMHRESKKFILDLVLRDNNTSEEYPLGIFHPHQELWHIKKENIGLIEVMGRAILPGRLKDELQEVKKYWLNQENKIATSHLTWAKKIKDREKITKQNVNQIMHQALIDVFEQVLSDSGVFKNNQAGKEGWQKFISSLKQEVD